jgi:ABC-type amino acid transport substrate-binding protein
MNEQNFVSINASSTLRAAAKKPVSRRVLLKGTLATALAAAGTTLVGCGSSSSDDATATASTGDTIRVGMEAAYAPYNWQTSEATEYTIPIDNVAGAYADGYDVQIAKRIGEAFGAEPVAVKLAFSGLIDALNSGQIDMIIAGMSATDERRESIDFSDSYFDGKFGLFVMEGSPYENATTLAEFAGASVLGQKDTLLDDCIDEIPGVNHLTPVDSVPNMMSRLTQGTCDAITYNMENEEGYMRANPGIVPIKFAEGDGFDLIINNNVGVVKGYERLDEINEVLANISDADRQEIWDGVLERQPA